MSLRTVGTIPAGSPIVDERGRSAGLAKGLRSIPSESLWLADLHGVGVANLRGDAAADQMRAAFGKAPEHVGQLVELEGFWAGRLAADELLLIAKDPSALEIDLSPIEENESERLLTVTDTTHGHSVIAVGGPDARLWLGMLTGVDLRDSAFPDSQIVQTGMANVHATVIRNDIGGTETYIVLVARSVGAFAWNALLDASPVEDLARLDGGYLRERWFAE